MLIVSLLFLATVGAVSVYAVKKKVRSGRAKNINSHLVGAAEYIEEFSMSWDARQNNAVSCSLLPSPSLLIV